MIAITIDFNELMKIVRALGSAHGAMSVIEIANDLTIGQKAGLMKILGDIDDAQTVIREAIEK